MHFHRKEYMTINTEWIKDKAVCVERCWENNALLPVSFIMLYSDWNRFLGVTIPMLTVLSLAVSKAYGLAWQIQRLMSPSFGSWRTMTTDLEDRILQLRKPRLEGCCYDPYYQASVLDYSSSKWQSWAPIPWFLNFWCWDFEGLPAL